MKTISKRFLKGGLAILLAVIMLFSSCITGFAAVVDTAETAVDTADGTVFYLKPNSNWLEANPRFAAYFQDGSSNASWYSMTGSYNGYYRAVSNGTHKHIIFCRMNGSNATNNWNNKWNQSDNLTWDGTNNICTIKSGYWDCGTNVTWSSTSDYYLLGDFNNWSIVAANKFNSNKYTVSIPEGTTEFKLYNKTFTAYYGNTGNMISGNSGWSFHPYEGANCTLTSDGGVYTFTLDPKTEKISLASTGFSFTTSAETGGTASASATTAYTKTGATITATPAAGYKFVGWEVTNGKIEDANSASTTFRPIANGATATAKFELDGYSYTVTAGEGGTASPASGTATSVEITATPNDGYEFVSWETTNGSVASTTAAKTTFTITATNANAHATFAPEDYTVTLNTDGGTINSGNVTGYTFGNTVTLPTDVTKTGYTFKGWKDASGNTVTQIKSTDYGNKSYTAQWEINTYTITVKQNAGGSTKVGSNTAYTGTTDKTYTYNYGTSVTVVVTPSTNYKITGISGAVSNGESTTAVTKKFTVTDDATINVNFALAGSCSVSFAKGNTSQNLVIGGTYTNTASTDATYCTDKANGTVTYSSSDSTIASVSSSGVVTANKPGTATITATCKTDTSASASYQVTVLEPELTFDEITLDVNGTADADNYRTVGNAPTSSYTVTYTAITSGEVRITSAGVITAMGPTTGVQVTAKITCGSWSDTVTFPVAVNTPVLNFNPKAVNLITGQTMTEAFVASANVGNPTITITSDDDDVLTIGNDNKGTATGMGSTTVTATFTFNNYYKPTATSNVLVAEPTITADPTSVALEYGEGVTDSAKTTTVTLDPNTEDGNGTGDDITVETANASVATATVSGTTLTITATGLGSTTVKATFHGKTVEIPVTVTQYDPYAYIYVTDSFDWGTMYIYGWNGSSDVVIPKETPMIYIGRNNQNQRIFAYRILKTDLPEKAIFKKGTDWGYQSTDTVLTDAAVQAYYFDSDTWAMKSWNIDLVRPTVSVDNVVVPVGGTETATATVENGGVVYWTIEDSNIATVADVTTATTTVTGVTVDDTTITARAFIDTTKSSIVDLPENYKTQTSCWDYISTEATATVTVGSVDYEVSVNAEAGGTASIKVGNEDKGTSASIAYGTEYTLTATANDGYRFLGWYNGEDVVSTEATYTTTAKAAVTYTAKFKKTYTVSVIIGEGIEFIKYNNVQHNESFENIEVDEGASFTVYASPSTNYAFTNWTDANEPVSSNPTYTVDNVNADVVLTANAVPVYTATAYNYVNRVLDANGTYGGTIAIGGQSSPVQYKAGETVTFTATPKTNYYFDGWYSDVGFTNRVSDDAEYEVTMTADGITLYGLFVKNFYLTSSNDEKLATFVYNVAKNEYSVTADFTDHFTITSNDNNDVNATDVNVTGGTHTGATVTGNANGYTLVPDTENYDINKPVTYTLNPDVANGTPDGTYTMNITLQEAEKVAISVDGTKVADKAIGSTFEYEIDAPDGQYLSSATTDSDVDIEIVDGKIKFTVPNTDVNIVPTFANYSYVEFTDTTGLTITGLKDGGYKAGENISIAVAPATDMVTIKELEVPENSGLTATKDGSNYTITGTLTAGQTVTVTPTVEAKFKADATQVAIGNYGTGVTVFGTVALSVNGVDKALGSYFDNGTEVTYKATPSDNYVFDGFYSNADCTELLTHDAEYKTTLSADTTVYALFARKQWMTFDHSKTTGTYVKELVYDSSIGAYTLTTTITSGNSTDSAINTGAWFRVTNDTSKWDTAEGYHAFDASKFTVSHNAKRFDATISWHNDGNSWKLTTSGANDTAIRFILTPTGNTAIDFSAQVGDPTGDAVYLSSGRLDVATVNDSDVFSAVSVFTDTDETFADNTVKNGDTEVEKYKLRALDKPQTVSFKTTISGTMAEHYVIDKFVVYHANEQKYSIIEPNPIGNDAYTGSVYAEGPCYIVPIYFLTSEYAEANGLVEIDIYFDATDIQDHSWGPFVACYAWGEHVDFFGAWSGQLMIPTEDGSSFYTMLTVPASTAEEGKPHGVTFNNYMANTVPGANPGAMGVTAMPYQTYDYREPLSLYEDGYEVITFVAKDSTDGYHGDADSAKNATANTVTDADIDVNNYHFDYLYARDGVTPMDLKHNEIENPVNLATTKADYYIVTRGDVPYGVCYVGDEKPENLIKNTSNYGNTGYQGDWSVDWYVFDSDGKYLGHTLSAAYWDDTTNNLKDGVYTVLLDTLGLTADAVAGKTVAISYEHENNDKDNPHQISYDGQWYGSMLDDTIIASAVVGIIDENGEITIDNVEPNNEADYGEGWIVASEELDGIIVGDKYARLPITLDYGAVDLSATVKDGYRFVGWYTYSNNKYSKITASADYNTYISNDTTYYAMFEKIGDGQIVINHRVYDNPNDSYIPSHGGVAEMLVEVLDSQGNIVESGSTPDTSISTAVFTPEINQTYTIRISTTPLMNGTFFAWYGDSETVDGTKTYEEILVEPGMIGSTKKVVATFEYIYDPLGPNTINIYSDVTRVSNKADLFYRYLNRYGEWRTYTVRDIELTDDECMGYEGNEYHAYYPTYLTKYTLAGDEVVYGDEALAGRDFIDSYNMIQYYAPNYEVTEVFNGTVSWSVDKATVTPGKSIVTIVADQGTPNYTITYDMGGEIGHVTGKYNTLVDDIKPIVAPDEYNGAKFAYWVELKDIDGDGNDDQEVFLSYQKNYSYRIVEDKKIKAIYSNEEVADWTPSIDSVTYTREFSDDSDVIYTDFLLAYNSKNGLKLNDVKTDMNITYGLIMVQDPNSSYTGENDTLKFPEYNKANLEKSALAGRNGLIDGIRYYNFDLTNLTLTNFNRCDYFKSYDNRDTANNFMSVEYTCVAYMVVDETVYLSTPQYVNFYDLAMTYHSTAN